MNSIPLFLCGYTRKKCDFAICSKEKKCLVKWTILNTPPNPLYFSRVICGLSERSSQTNWEKPHSVPLCAMQAGLHLLFWMFLLSVLHTSSCRSFQMPVQHYSHLFSAPNHENINVQVWFLGTREAQPGKYWKSVTESKKKRQFAGNLGHFFMSTWLLLHWTSLTLKNHLAWNYMLLSYEIAFSLIFFFCQCHNSSPICLFGSFYYAVSLKKNI